MRRLLCFLVMLGILPALAANPSIGDADDVREALLDVRQDFSDVLAEVSALRLDAASGGAGTERLDARVSQLAQSAMLIDEELTRLYAALNEYERRLSYTRVICLVITVILAIVTAGKLVCYVLYFRNVRLPRFIDVLL